MTTMAKSLQPPPPDPDLELSTETATKLIAQIGPDLQRLKWFLWHGNVFRALRTVEDLTADLETLHPGEEPESWAVTNRFRRWAWDSNRASTLSRARSAQDGRGRTTWRRKTFTWWRSSRISSTLDASDRPRSPIHALS